VLGIGPGTFEYYWAREGDPDAAIFVRDAHSLYLEMLAELGPFGFLLVVGFIAAVLIAGAIRTFRARDEDRSILAAAVAGCVAFAAAAAVDWIWELAALGAVFMLLAAVVVADERSGRAASTAGRIATAGLAVLGLIAVAVPFTATSLVERSREAVAEDRLDDALQDARDAVAVQPSAARPRIQEANVLELMGDVGGALVAAREATDREPTNWRLWIVLSRLEARAGNAEAAVDAFTEAQSLFPRGVEAPE
jgi:tetratricopeptide (TPR) repeat protein